MPARSGRCTSRTPQRFDGAAPEVRRRKPIEPPGPGSVSPGDPDLSGPGDGIRVDFASSTSAKKATTPSAPAVSAIHVTTSNYVTTAGIGLGATSARLRAAYGRLEACGLQRLCLAGRDGSGRRTVTRFDLGLTSATANHVVGISVTS